VVCASIRRLLAERSLERLRVDAVKVAHHGSKGNTSDELMALVESPRYLFSTNGAQFGHPDHEAVQRIIGRSTTLVPTLYFNYRTPHNGEWESPALQQRLKYRTHYNPDEAQPLVVTL
jgi:beta-lactamase superfamily II metal-dependent hydrolase